MRDWRSASRAERRRALGRALVGDDHRDRAEAHDQYRQPDAEDSPVKAQARWEVRA